MADLDSNSVFSDTSDPAEYYSHSSQWSSPSDDLVDPNGAHTDLDDVSDDLLETARQASSSAEEDTDTLPTYGHFLHALRDIVSARNGTQQVTSLKSVKISIGRRVQGDFVPPVKLRTWFEADIETFEAPI